MGCWIDLYFRSRRRCLVELLSNSTKLSALIRLIWETPGSKKLIKLAQHFIICANYTIITAVRGRGLTLIVSRALLDRICTALENDSAARLSDTIGRHLWHFWREESNHKGLVVHLEWRRTKWAHYLLRLRVWDRGFAIRDRDELYHKAALSWLLWVMSLWELNT